MSDTAHPDLAAGATRSRPRITSSGTTTFDLGGHTGAAVLLWITDLGDGTGDSSGRVHAQIAELQRQAAK